MVPMCMVNEETLNQVPDDVRQYLRALRRRIIELEREDAQQRIAELEAANRKLQAQVDELRAQARQQQEKIWAWPLFDGPKNDGSSGLTARGGDKASSWDEDMGIAG